MTRYQFSITIPANGSAALNLAAQAFAGTAGVSYPSGWTNVYGTAYLAFCKLQAYMDAGDTGIGYIGPSNVTFAGVNKAYDLNAPAGAGLVGGMTNIESQTDSNIGDLSQYWAHGGVAGDKMVIVYHQS